MPSWRGGRLISQTHWWSYHLPMWRRVKVPCWQQKSMTSLDFQSAICIVPYEASRCLVERRCPRVVRLPRFMLNVPVALMFFNRPSETRRVLDEIRAAKPRQLFLIADGPRPDRPEDEAKCAATRALVEIIDWPCEVFRNYADVNLGPGRRPVTGISWVFEHVDRAIILEDDCVPHPTFFPFCEELLQKYADDRRIMMIAGTNLYPMPTRYSYHFCYHHSNWGWATWRRAWQHFDPLIRQWPLLPDTSWLSDILTQPRAIEAWKSIFARVHARPVDYWDYQWTFSMWRQYAFALTPAVNLISNIGFGNDATHTRSVSDSKGHRAVTEMALPLTHPPLIVRNKQEDRLAFKAHGRSGSPNAYRRIYRRIRSVGGVVWRRLRRPSLRGLTTTVPEWLDKVPEPLIWMLILIFILIST